ncbi:M20/M25/M40 family metallo-hydrolase [Herbiconiux solani]|uniref:M20/M25/M40 family metallo-hydrolase n=1 Tax=Herbiconiux solani TaxID=661329 RepID=UPI00082629DE|nr:M20/M25/M40 family metallo-hydrolase [Herbiconiux solani]
MSVQGTLEDEALDEIRALIRIPSVNTGEAATIGDGEARAARYVQERLEEAGYETHYVEPALGRGSVVARLAGRDPDAGALVVHAHLDVVPVEEAEWTHPPFGAEIHDGVLYGRGAVDMKNFAGTVLAVARAFARDGVRPRRDLIFAFFADEEAGGVWGARWLVENRPELFAGATEALGEVGGFSVPLGGDRRGYLVATAEKGVATATLVATGRGGHGSRPTPGNAVVALARAVGAVDALRFELVRSPGLEAFLAAVPGGGEPAALTEEAAAAATSAGMRTADDLQTRLARLGTAGRLVTDGARTTATPTVLAAGAKPNVIPSRAVARVDVRVLPGEYESVQRTLAEAVGRDIAVEWSELIPPIESPLDSPLLAVLERAVSAEDPGARILPFQLPASTDNKHLARLGIRGYGFVPLRVPDEFDAFGLFHAADECVPVDALAFLARVTERVLREA